MNAATRPKPLPQRPQRDEACVRAIARAVWTEIHWLMPRGPHRHHHRARRRYRRCSRPIRFDRSPDHARLQTLMKLLADNQRERPLANGASPGDHVPVVKLSNLTGAATWLVSDLDPGEPDIALLLTLSST